MIPEGQDIGPAWRAALAALALGVTSLIIYALFSSGFGRPPHTAARTPEPAPILIPAEPPAIVLAAGPSRATTLAVVSDDLWLTYLPQGLERAGGGASWARFGSADRFVEARVEHGTVAADWDGYRERTTVLDARTTTVRGKPATVGRYPGGGRVIVWLERAGVGAWIRVSESLGDELVAIAASVRAPVRD